MKSRKWKYRIVPIALLVTCTAMTGYSQIEGYSESMEDPLVVYIDAISFSTGDSTNARLDVYIQVGYDQLSFVRSKQSYVAQYEVTVGVYDERDRLVIEKIWNDRATTDSFDVSISPQFYIMSEKSLTLQPGMYTLKIVYLDLESKRGMKETRKILIPDYVHKLTEISDIMLVSKITKDGERRTITPNISGNVGNLEGGFSLFFEFYPVGKSDSVEFQYSIITPAKETVYSGTKMERVQKQGMQVFINIDTIDITPGEYTLQVVSRTHGADKTQDVVSTSHRQISMRWKGVPLAINDLDEAIKQLRYIAKDADLDSLEEAKTVHEKQKKFMEFWKKKDPTPDTPKNELMEEYYRRVAFTNKRFTRYRPGWKTDMGMIYIIFGPPNTVDRHPFEMDSKPYEIWTYYDIRQSLIFIDETGFGDYRLQNLDWELWRRIPRQ
jgi:GWxTD domain-containing protein